MRFIALGKITKPFGVRGEIRIKPHNPETTWFHEAEGVWLRRREHDEPRFIRIIKARSHQEFVVLALEGIRDRDQAEELRGQEVVSPEDQLQPLDDGEYYWYQLVGMMVETTEGKAIGEVVRMEETASRLGGNDLFVVRAEEGEILIPATEENVANVDLDANKIIVAPTPE